MRAFAIALLAVSTATPALAQHADHEMPTAEPEPKDERETATVRDDTKPPPATSSDTTADPHAGHDMDRMVQPEPDAHIGRQMPEEQDADDPHAGHRMEGQPVPSSDPMPGHVMGMEHPAPMPPEAPTPPEAFSGPEHAADTIFNPGVMAEKRENLRRNQGGMTTYWLMADRLEAQIRDGDDAYLWDVQGWYGGDIDKLWIKSEGEGSFGESPEDAEVQALWSHAIGPWFDLQAGVRYDFRPDPERAHLVLGVQGLLPYVFEVDAAAFLSDEGDLTARVEAEYDQRITQRLILQPRLEFNLSAQDVPEIGLGSGLTSIEPGLRLRYEFVREFAPYIGVEYARKLGDTADFARAEDEDVGGWSFVLGLRAWF